MSVMSTAAAPMLEHEPVLEIAHPELNSLLKVSRAAAHELHVHVRGCEHCLYGDDENERCQRFRQHAQEAHTAVLRYVDEHYVPKDSGPLPARN